MTSSTLHQLCLALIEELAALGGEQMLFSHMKRAVEKSAGTGDLAALQATWKDLRIWTRGLTPRQRQDVAERMRLRCGIDLVEEDREQPDGERAEQAGGRRESSR